MCAGTAAAGHYYSYIREREGDGRSWWLFDDSSAIKCRLGKLPDCRGGDDTAYMLFYERKEARSRSTLPGRRWCRGLTNQGTTCYANAIIQQLYMCPAIRNIVLGLKLGG